MSKEYFDECKKIVEDLGKRFVASKRLCGHELTFEQFIEQYTRFVKQIFPKLRSGLPFDLSDTDLITAAYNELVKHRPILIKKIEHLTTKKNVNPAIDDVLAQKVANILCDRTKRLQFIERVLEILEDLFGDGDSNGAPRLGR